jgi:carboxypeptidase Q
MDMARVAPRKPSRLRSSPGALAAALTALALAAPPGAEAQTFPTTDPVIQGIWERGMDPERSHARDLAQALMDSIGPRLSGSPGFHRAVDWAQSTLTGWGIETERQQYGTWVSWEGDYIHADLTAPRRRTLEAAILAWSPGTDGPVEGDAVVLPSLAGAPEFQEWLQGVRGKFVLISLPEPSCRAEQEWNTWGMPESYQAIQEQRSRDQVEWNQRLLRVGGQAVISRSLEEAGALGVVTSRWSGGWGVNKVFSSATREIPSIDLSCEDYGLLFRLAEEGQGPRMRLNVEARFLGEESPMYNVVGMIPGTELPDEYVILSAHLDSWHAASGATDNGTGTVTMMEAMRILKEVYPNPRRTILIGLWGGEEQGLIGSHSFAIDNPEITENLQAAFNQDNGTWRIDYIRMQGFTGAGAHFGRWFGSIPQEITQHIELAIPGVPEQGGSDHMAFICRGVPGFRLQSSYPEYRQYTWHTNRDTFDKISFDDLRNNATLTAMLAYMASEDPERVPRDQMVVPGSGGQPGRWPGCGNPRRSWSEGQPR